MLTMGSAAHAGLRIQRMPSELGQEFNDVARYPYMAVASPSCHDTTTTRLWWEEDAGRRERLFFEELHLQVRNCIVTLASGRTGVPRSTGQARQCGLARRMLPVVLIIGKICREGPLQMSPLQPASHNVAVAICGATAI